MTEEFPFLEPPPEAKELDELLRSLLEQIAAGLTIPADQKAKLDSLITRKLNWIV